MANIELLYFRMIEFVCLILSSSQFVFRFWVTDIQSRPIAQIGNIAQTGNAIPN